MVSMLQQITAELAQSVADYVSNLEDGQVSFSIGLASAVDRFVVHVNIKVTANLNKSISPLGGK